MSSALQTPIPAPVDRSTDSKIFWRLIPIILVSLVVNQLDKVNVAFAKLEMAPDIGLSNAAYGLGAGIFFIGYCLFEVPSNMLLHRLGARMWITRIMVTWGILSACTMFVTGPMSFYAVRFLLGVAEAGFAPGIMLYVSQWFPARTRGRVIATFMTALPISGVIGSPLSAWLMTAAPDFLPIKGWQWMFLCEGLPAVFLGFLFWTMVPDKIDDARWLSAQEKMALKAEVGDTDSHREGSFARGLSDGRVWMLCLIYFLFVAALYGVSFWLPTLIKTLGFSDIRQIGFMTALPYAAAVVTMLALAWNSDRTGERRLHLAAAGVLGGASLVLSVVWHAQPWWSFGALIVAMAGIVTTIPLFWNLPTAFLKGATAATGFALITSIGNLSGFAAPYMMGAVSDATGATSMGMYVLACAAFAGVALTLRVPARLVERAGDRR
ncbi:Putative metabolite transport protein NicT [Achromobacter veterisilvae]|uniref:Metabolite transport protein NicT n=1 Tax=Achromobacter veterisilvae TaxID=2069367 RepID=A0A446C728_9BURK|nr:MFS transporter [Achromobacter veterisilvae]SSW63712.1 Putative metabolite transport protein NicT [Achromobacter veterisilvae]